MAVCLYCCCEVASPTHATWVPNVLYLLCDVGVIDVKWWWWLTMSAESTIVPWAYFHLLFWIYVEKWTVFVATFTWKINELHFKNEFKAIILIHFSVTTIFNSVYSTGLIS